MVASEYVVQLRSELKQWETSFAEEHGRKPSRDDIKKVPEIAAKYKEYNKLRDSTSAKSSSTQSQLQSQFETPRKTTRHSSREISQPPSDSNTTTKHNADVDPFQSPPLHQSQRSATQRSSSSSRSSRRIAQDPHQTPTNPNRISSTITTPSGGKSTLSFDSPISSRRIRFGKDGETIGPTPQKTGRVLGLFESMMVKGTPSPQKPTAGAGSIWNTPRTTATSSTAPVVMNSTTNSPEKPITTSTTNPLFSTPRKRKLDSAVDAIETSPSLQPTATANSTSRNPSVHTTPTTLPIGDNKTPKKRRPSEADDMFTTPTFLRRSSSRIIMETSSPPIPVPMIRKGPAKGLTSLMADLRKRQEEILDEEMELLREMENDAESGGVKSAKKALFPATTSTTTTPIAKDKTDTTTTTLTTTPNGDEDIFGSGGGKDTVDLIGINAPDLSDDEENAAAGGDKPPPRVWKKRGLKRQTRRVKMRPVKTKLSSSVPLNSNSDSDSAEEEEPTRNGEAADTTDISLKTTDPSTIPNQDDEDSASEYSTSEEDPSPKSLGRPAKAKMATNTTTTTKISTKTQDGSSTATSKSKTGKKRSATTGANYRRLNIRTSGGRGRGRGRGRFGYGRR